MKSNCKGPGAGLVCGTEKAGVLETQWIMEGVVGEEVGCVGETCWMRYQPSEK